MNRFDLQTAQHSLKRQTRSAAPQLEDLKTVKQLCQEYPHLFTEGSLRWLIFNGETNGFAACIIRAGRRLLIDVRALRHWMAQHRGSTSKGLAETGDSTRRPTRS